MKFRKLKASEIDVRIQSTKEKGMVILLYKNARVDMQLLDETVGIMNWQRDHKELKGNIYAGISILDKETKQWVTKWDAGAESNTEAVKGEASDSFKRAAFNWGIGRELYTAPFTWVKGLNGEIEKANNNRYKCYTKFFVSSIEYHKDTIKALVINDEKGNTRFTYGNTDLDLGVRLERATQQLVEVTAEWDKEQLSPKLILECSNDKVLAKDVLKSTLLSYGIEWTDLDLTKIPEKDFMDRFKEQLKIKLELKAKGL